MSKFTKESPFEHDGRVIRPLDGGRNVNLRYKGNGYMISSGDAEAICAYVVAERNNEWHWTDDEKTEARKGRWTIVNGARRGFPQGDWGISNDEFRSAQEGFWCISVYDHDKGFSGATLPWTIRKAFESVMDDFLAWLDSQQEEPAEYGYVGYVIDKDGDRWDITRDSWSATFDNDEDVSYDWIRRRDGESESGSWKQVLALGKFTAESR